MTAEYRDFLYPLNVFMHILTMEEGRVAALHYGLFESSDESIEVAQRRSTELLLDRLPTPPASLLDVGLGLGDTLAELKRLGYRAVGITPDEKQIAAARNRHADLDARCVPLETFEAEMFDVVLFQESSQYIDSNALWRRMQDLARDRVIVLDEFSTTGEGTLHSLQRFLDAATLQGFRKIEEIDFSKKAAPSTQYFLDRLPRYREALIRDVGITSKQVDELIESGENYRDQYVRGIYTYRLLVFER
jgi:SAM-dependent methyltransferase